MATSAQMVAYLQSVIVNDAVSPLPVVPYFLKSNMTGGWEAWLQVEFARTACSNLGIGCNFEREASFDVPPGTPAKRCDLKFTPARGTAIWFELKTQRNATYKTTVLDFISDCKKIVGQSDAWKQANVFVASAILKIGVGDGTALNTFRSNRPTGGNLNYYLYTSPRSFQDVTETILNQTTNANQMILAIYRAN